MGELPYTFQRDVKRVLKEVAHLEHIYRQDGRQEIKDALLQMRESMAEWPVKPSSATAEMSPGQQAAHDAGSRANVAPPQAAPQESKYGRRADQPSDWNTATEKAVQLMANAVGQAAAVDGGGAGGGNAGDAGGTSGASGT